MYYIQVLILFSLIISISLISIGRVQNARLLPGLKNQTAWLLNQTNANACLCNAMKRYSLSNIAALNSFSLNGTCQVILSPPVLSPKIIFDSKSTLVLLQTLDDIPCCSDLTWVLDRITNSARKSKVSVTAPTHLSIDSANQFVTTMNYRTNKLVRLYRQNMTLNGIYQLPTGYVCVSAIHRKGCDTPAALVIFNETNLTTPVTQINMTLYVRTASFARNDTLMFVAVQRGTYSLYVYNISWTPKISTSLIQTFPLLTDQTWATHTVNDSFILMTSWETIEPVYAIKSSSTTSNTWSRFALSTTKVKGSEELGEAVVDSCGRIWVIVYTFGIRIYDPSATVLLANWTFSSGLGNILLLDNYELYLSDYLYNFVYYFNPNLQCTS